MISALLGECVTDPYEGQSKPPLEVVIATSKRGIFIMVKLDVIKEYIDNFLQNYSEKYTNATIYYLKDVIVETVSAINNNLKEYPNVHLLYSIKANYNFEILELLSEYVYGFDVASYQEVDKVEKYLDYVDYISASGYGFTIIELVDTISKGIHVDFMSISQIETVVEKLIGEYSGIGIRINIPRSKIGNHRNRKSRFGIEFEEGHKLQELCFYNKLVLERIHLHGGLKTMEDIIIIGDEIEKWINLFETIKYVNLGGGWDYLFQTQSIEEALRYITTRFPKIQFYIEPGSLLVRNAGILVSRVIDYQYGDKNFGFAVLDCSDFNLSSWYKSQVIAVLSQSNCALEKEVEIVGNTCYEDDWFQIKCNKKIGIGDLIFLYPVGAYYLTTHRRLHDLKFPIEKLV